MGLPPPIPEPQNSDTVGSSDAETIPHPPNDVNEAQPPSPHPSDFTTESDTDGEPPPCRPRSGFQAFVRRLQPHATGSSIVVHCYQSDTVAFLKLQLQASTGVPVDMQILKFLGTDLPDHLRLVDCQIEHGDFITMIARLHGGVPPASSTTPLSSIADAAFRKGK